MLDYTKNDIEKLRNDNLAKFLLGMVGLDPEKVFNEAEAELEKENTPKVEPTPVGEPNTSFVLSQEQLKQFIDKYLEIEGTIKKLDYAYGVDLNSRANSIYTKYNDIIWSLIRAIFGSDNTDDISDYVFGNSNFDSVEDLYNELV